MKRTGAAMTLLLLALQSAPPPALPPDPRLDAEVAADLRIEPLPDALAALGRRTGVMLTVELPMRGLKTTIFTGPRPLRRTMTDLASVFDAEWEPRPTSGGGGVAYRLAMPPAARGRLRLAVEARRDAALAGVRTALRAATLAARTPWLALPSAAREADEDFSTFTSPNAPGFREAHERADAYGRVRRESYLTGRAILGLDERGLARFLAGEPIVASSRARGRALALPLESAYYADSPRSGLRGADGGPPDPKATLPPVRLFLRYVPETGEYASMLVGDALGGGTTGVYGGNAESPYLDAWNAWGLDLEAARTSDLDRKLTDAKPEISPWAGVGVTDTEHLAALRRRTGLDIVAEATRRRSDRPPSPFPGPTLRDALKSWESHGPLRVEGGALLYRPYNAPLRRDDEPPEAALRRFEALASPTVDDRAALALALSPGQARRLTDHLARRSLLTFNLGLPALRVWGALTPGERAALLAGDPLPFARMSPAVRTLSEAAIVAGVFEGGTPSERLLALFDAPWNPAALGDLALWATTKDIATPRMSAGYSGSDESLTERAPSLPGLRLEFGPAPGGGMTFTVPR